MNSTITHTPGPWCLVETTTDAGNLTHQVEAPNGHIVTYALPRTSAKPELMSNARLIAATPELFKACELIIRARNDGGISMADLHQAAYDAAVSAIAKAKGGSK